MKKPIQRIQRLNLSMQRIAQTGAVMVTAGTMAILYYGLMELAKEAGYNQWQAILFPFPIDGLVRVAYVSAYAFESRKARGYAWGVVVFGALLSALGQYLHTDSLVGTVVKGIPIAPGGQAHTVQWWAPLLAVAPAVASPLALHIAVTLTRMTAPVPKPSTATTGISVPVLGSVFPETPSEVRPQSARDGWPTQVEDDLKRIAAGEMLVADLARRVVRDRIRTSSPDLSNARKLVNKWLQNYQSANPVINEVTAE